MRESVRAGERTPMSSGADFLTAIATSIAALALSAPAAVAAWASAIALSTVV